MGKGKQLDRLGMATKEGRGERGAMEGEMPVLPLALEGAALLHSPSSKQEQQVFVQKPNEKNEV